MYPPSSDLSPAERAECAALIRVGSKSFHAASLVLPPAARADARALYAFCRHADDLVDESGEAGAARRLRDRIQAIYAGEPGPSIAARAFAAVAARRRIPAALPLALIEGFEWDEAGRRYATLDDLLGYAARVASTVGVMMALIMDRRDPHVLARAADLGLAMQLTNIARDVGEDARNGRIYLPLDWLAEEGVDPEALLASPEPGPGMRRAVARLLAAADRYYARALTGVAGLPAGCRPAIAAAGLIYRAIGTEIARNGHDSVTRRARTGAGRKAALLLRAGAASATLTPVNREPPDPATAFLIDAAAERGAPIGVDAAMDRFIALWIEMERREPFLRL